MIADIWRHIKTKEQQLGMQALPWEDDNSDEEDYFDAQEYYQWLCDESNGTRIDGHNDF